MLWTWEAKTFKSGSAIVIKSPIKKHTSKTIFKLFVFDNPEPTCSPIGDIAISAPKLNNPIPKIKHTEEKTKTS